MTKRGPATTVLPPTDARLSATVVAAIIGLILLASPGFTQELSSQPAFSLTVQVERSRLVLGEPVYVTVRLINRGASPASVTKLLSPQTGVVQVRIAMNEGAPVVFLPLFHADVADALSSLTPGEEVAAVFPIFYGALGWTFREPGTYRVSASYHGLPQEENRQIRSDLVTIVVEEEEGGVGRFLMDGSAASDEAGKFLLWQRGDHLRVGQEHLRALLTTFPDSPLVDYVHLAFGRNFGRAFRNYAIGQLRQPDCRTALTHLQQIHLDRLPRLLQIQAALTQGRCLRAEGQNAEAREAWTRAQTLAGDRPEFRLLFQYPKEGDSPER